MGRSPPAIAVSDDDFEEYEEFLAWKRKHGLRATIKKMAKRDRFRSDSTDSDDDPVPTVVSDAKTSKKVSKLNRAIAK